MKKLMNKKAFTIMEMLIVVAIIAVLVAIAIPTFSSALEKAKEAADVANIRATVAEIQVECLVDNDTTNVPTSANTFATTVETKSAQKLNHKDYITYKAATTSSPVIIGYDTTSHKLGKAYTWEVGDVATTTTQQGSQTQGGGQ